MVTTPATCSDRRHLTLSHHSSYIWMTQLESNVELTKSFYTPAEVAELARVHRSTILNYIASGRLYAVKLSERTYRIPARAVLRLLEPERLTAPIVTEEPYAAVSLDDLPGERPARRIAER